MAPRKKTTAPSAPEDMVKAVFKKAAVVEMKNKFTIAADPEAEPVKYIFAGLAASKSDAWKIAAGAI